MTLDPIKTLEMALKINRRAATFLIGGFLLLALAAFFGNQVKDSGLTFWHIPIALLIFSVLVAVLAKMPDTLALVACWTLVVLALLFAVGVTGQVLAGNTLPYAKLDCLTGFWTPGACSTSPVVVPPDAGDVVAETDISDSSPATDVTAPTTAEVDRASTTVFIQFTGFERADVQGIASTLLAKGWPIQGADQGGERYDHAAGLNEVRFFNPQDKARAHELSAAMAGKSIQVLDVSDSAYAMDTPGHLEIWISQNSKS